MPTPEALAEPENSLLKYEASAKAYFCMFYTHRISYGCQNDIGEMLVMLVWLQYRMVTG